MGPVTETKTSFETMTPRAKAVAAAARAAACQVIMTPGGPLPSPAGCPGHADWHAAAAGNDVRTFALSFACTLAGSHLWSHIGLYSLCLSAER